MPASRCRLPHALLPTLTLWALLLLALIPRWAPAADGPTAATPGPAAAAPGNDAPKERVIEQSIYIPYARLREVFEKQGRGVFLPYEQFRELWDAARAHQAPPAGDKPPVALLISQASHQALVAGDVVQVKARLQIDLLRAGWQRIPLRLRDAAITSASVNGGKAMLVFNEKTGYELLLEKKGDKPEQVTLDLEYAKAIDKAPAQYSVSFEAPQAPVSRWEVRIPEAGVKVNVSPMLAASEAPAPADNAAETRVLAFVGAAPLVRLDWTPRAQGATGLEALASVEVQQQVTVEEGVLRTRAELTYQISRAQLTQLRLQLPADQKVVNVYDPNVRQWSVETTEQTQTLSVQLFEPATSRQKVSVELEQFTGEEAKQTLSIPAVRALDVSRQQGVVVLRLAAALQGEIARRVGLQQVDASELPPELAKQSWHFAYRYATAAFDLALNVEKVQPRIEADSLVQLHVRPEVLSMSALVVYQVERAGVFRLELEIPAGFSVTQVSGRAFADVAAAEVESRHADPANPQRLVVNLSRRALGRVALALELVRSLNEPDLLSPTGKTVAAQVQLPRPVGDALQQQRGRLIVSAPESLRVNPSSSSGLRSVSSDQILQDFPAPAAVAQRSDERAMLFYSFAQEPAQLSLGLERRKPQVTAAQLLVVRVEPGVAHFEATFSYDIRYSGVKSLRIDLPKDLAAQIHNTTASIREQPIDPAPADVAPGYVAWSYSGERELFGAVNLVLRWEQKIQKLEVGKSVALSVPQLRPMGVDRAWGQIVLAKAESIDVTPAGSGKGLRPIDPQHDLIGGKVIADAARAFEFHEDWSLPLTVAHYQLETVKRTSLERALIRMVVTRSDQISVQALYRVRSARQRLMVQLPPNATFDSDPLRINGKAAPLERGEEERLLVPLVGQQADAPMLLELRYSLPGADDLLVLPVFPEEPAVQKVYLSVYLPEERDLMGYRGPWEDQLHWVGDFPILRPYPATSDQDLLNWVQERLPVVPSGDPFQVDGRGYLFSTMAPPTPADLRLTTINHTIFAWLIPLIALTIGVVLLFFRAALRLLICGVILTGLVICGLLLPTFSRQLFAGAFLPTLLLVLVIWVVHYLAWIRPRDPELQALRAARLQARWQALKQAAGPTPAVEGPSADAGDAGSDDAGQTKGGKDNV